MVVAATVVLQRGLQSSAAEPKFRIMRERDPSTAQGCTLENTLEVLVSKLGADSGRSRTRVLSHLLTDDALLDEIDQQMGDVVTKLTMLRDLVREAEKRKLPWEVWER